MGKKILGMAALLALSFIISLVWLVPSASAFTEEQKLLLQSWRIVNQAYVDETFNNQNWWFLRQKFLKRPLNDREEAYKAVEEMLGTLDDPYTRLLRPQEYKSLQVNTSGELSGVGLQINNNPKTGQLEVVAPLAGSPAEKAGITPKDQILEIDGVKTINLSLDEAAAKMRGKIGTTVSLTIKSGSDLESNTRIVDLVRDRISLNPVVANLDDRSGENIGYLRLNQFSANAPREIAHSLVKLQQEGANAYILDLRNNPGGLLQAGITIARLWLDESTIVYTVNRQGVSDSFESYGPPLTEDPLVLLVNQKTASASEILAGALQDNHRAKLVGEKTFGKGLIQSLFELPDGAGLAVTVAKYETPNHKDINKLGIVPDDVIYQDRISLQQIGSDADKQYQEAVRLLTADSVLADAR